MKSTSFKSLVMVGLLAAAGATMAQPGSAQGGGMRERMDPAKMDAMVAKRHDALKTQLKLTAEQEPAWTTFTPAMKPANRAEMKRPDRAELDKLPTPERIDKMRALRNERMAAMNAEMDKREDATKAFYATLNADQKKTFDSAHARMGRHHGEHRGAGRMGDMRTKPQQPQ